MSFPNASGSQQTGGEYMLAFLGMHSSGAAKYGWEVDAESRQIVTVNSQGMFPLPTHDERDGRTLPPPFQGLQDGTRSASNAENEGDELDSALDALMLEESGSPPKTDRTAKKNTDEIWKELLLDPKYRRSLYFSHCILSETRELELLYHKFPQDQFADAADKEGNTGILLSAVEENGLNTLQWLREHGSSISQANHYGRTPLMEAALWGRLKTVRYLIEQRIDPGARDGNGMLAADLAADTPRNRKERKQRSGPFYREPPDADRRREQIKALLKRLQINDLQRT